MKGLAYSLAVCLPGLIKGLLFHLVVVVNAIMIWVNYKTHCIALLRCHIVLHIVF